MCAVPCRETPCHEKKKTMHTVMHIDCMYVCFENPPPSPPCITQHKTCQCTSESLTHSLTPHYAVRSVIHARTGSAPQQKKGDSQQPDATVPDPEHHHHQRSHHLQSQLQRQHHQYPDPHRPTSDHQAAAGQEEDGVVQVARQVQVQTREVEAVVAAAIAGVEAVVEIAIVKVVVAVLEVVERLQVSMETHR
jgi:hypothetical protein